MQFEMYRRRGRHWQYLGERTAADSIKAARTTAYVHHLRVVGVRPAGSLDRLYVYRFKHVPLLSYA